ncbi:MAG TPA: hypothetical protein VF621_06625 [Pyrinomonadaceae bacterium]|jgi:hypothetical protein
MRPGAIKLHIDEVVLHGFEPADRAALGAALETELARLLAAGDPTALTGASQVARIDGGAFEMPRHTAPDVAGTRLARAVYDGLTGQAVRSS